MAQEISLLGGPSDGMGLKLKTPLANTLGVVEKTESKGDQTVDYYLTEHPLTKRQVYAHPAVYARLIHGQTGDGEKGDGPLAPA